jgi:DnaA family protein
MRQLNLAIDVRSDARISDFAGPGWASVIDAMRQLHVGLLSRCFIHGVADTGKTHLLSALCESYLDMGRTAIQVSLIELVNAPTEVLQALESFDLVALDDLDAIVGMPHWEEAIYHLINRSWFLWQEVLQLTCRSDYLIYSLDSRKLRALACLLVRMLKIAVHYYLRC